MGRMHSNNKGKSGSSKPFDKSTPSWVSYKATEIEALVAKLAKDKLTAAQIGIQLRDQYGIPSVKSVTQKTITQILSEKKLTKELPQDLLDMIGHFVAITKHLEDNKQDKVARRGLELARSKINRLAKYYKNSGKLPEGWKFDSRRAGMYLG